TDLFDACGELLDQVVDVSVFLDELGDLRGGVNHRRVIAPAELLSDLGERAVRELATEIHGHLPRIDDLLRTTVAGQLLNGHAESLDDDLLDLLDRDFGHLALRED